MVIKCCSKLKFSIHKYQRIYHDNTVKLFLGVQCLLMNIVSYSSNVLTGKNFDVCLQVNQHAPASSDEKKTGSTLKVYYTSSGLRRSLSDSMQAISLNKTRKQEKIDLLGIQYMGNVILVSCLTP